MTTPNRDNLSLVRFYAWGTFDFEKLDKPEKNKTLKKFNSVLNGYGMIIRKLHGSQITSIRNNLPQPYRFGNPNYGVSDADEYALLNRKRPGKPRGIKKRFIKRGTIKELAQHVVTLLDGVSFNKDEHTNV